MEYNYEGIGKRIATERKEYCHLGQDELSLKLSQNYGIGMSRNTLSAIEMENIIIIILTSYLHFVNCLIVNLGICFANMMKNIVLLLI